MTEKTASICNIKKRQDLVSFNWRISQDWVIKGFKWHIAKQHLQIPAWRIQPRRKVQWPKTVEVSPYMYSVIEAQCKERWPRKDLATLAETTQQDDAEFEPTNVV